MSEADVQRAVKQEIARLAKGSTVQKHLFLDLEDTVIAPVMEGWFNTHLINTVKVKRFIAEFKPDAVHLFSFAIWDETQKAGFKLGTQSILEQELGIKLNLIPMVDVEIKQACCSVRGLFPDRVDFNDMSDFWGKHEAFRLFVRHLFRNAKNGEHVIDVALLDDAVINESFEWPDLQITGRILNIDTL